ncbi:unnamed protein product [Leuciscus chuanchicus]
MEDIQEKSYKVWSDSTHITQTGLPPAQLITQPVSHLSHPINTIRHPPTQPCPATPAVRVPSPSDATVINPRERSSDASCTTLSVLERQVQRTDDNGCHCGRSCSILSVYGEDPEPRSLTVL